MTKTISRSIDLDLTLVQSASAVVADIDGQMVALDIASGVCYGLNRVATRIWQLLQTPTTGREVCDQLLTEFDVPVATCQEQTMEVLENLLEATLIVRSQKG